MERLKHGENTVMAENIRRLRLENGFRCKDVICSLQLRGVEICSSSYSKLEAGKYNPSVALLTALTDVYQCDYEEFFKGCRAAAK